MHEFSARFQISFDRVRLSKKEFVEGKDGEGNDNNNNNGSTKTNESKIGTRGGRPRRRSSIRDDNWSQQKLHGTLKKCENSSVFDTSFTMIDCNYCSKYLHKFDILLYNSVLLLIILFSNEKCLKNSKTSIYIIHSH